MAGMDSVLAATLARRLDSLLASVSTGSAPTAVPPSPPVGDAASAQAQIATQTTSVPVGTSPHTTPATLPGATASQQATLSAAARTIDTILRLAPESPGAVQSTTPIWPAAPGQSAPALAPLLAAALKDALASSGLFYESHLSQWAAGSRAFEQLNQEPQRQWPAEANLTARLMAAGSEATLTRANVATLSQASLALPDSESPGAHSAHWDAGRRAPVAPTGPTASANLPNTASTLAQAASLSQTASSVLSGQAQATPNTAQSLGAPNDNSSAGGQTPLPAQAAAIAAVAHAPPEAVTLLRQQLEMLINPQFQWSGQAWPGASMEWQIEERPAHVEEDAFAPSPTWHTHLRLTLPALGVVDVTLGLSGQQLQARVLANTPDTASQLAASSEALRARLTTAGLVASQLTFGALDDASSAGATAGSAVNADPIFASSGAVAAPSGEAS